MAWNPSPEVAVARDAAAKLGAPISIVLWITPDGKQLGIATYGKTRALCDEAKKIGDVAFDAVMKRNSSDAHAQWIADHPQGNCER